MQKDIDGLRTWVEIDKRAVKHNYDTFRGIISSQTKLMAVAKSNAYGHDMGQFAHELEHLGADWIGVDSIVEALTLRKRGIKKPLLVFGYILSSRVADAVKNDVTITAASVTALNDIAGAQKEPVRIHIKIDTGMGRQGIYPSELDETLAVFAKNDHLILEGVYTHFAAAKNPSIREITDTQLERFNDVRERTIAWVKKEGRVLPVFHAAATGGAMLYPESHFDMVRIGIGMHGMWPSAATRAAREHTHPLKPILTWKTRLSEVKKLKAGDGVGYDLTERAFVDMLVGTCPVGYWHGYPRAYSSVAPVLINGKRARVIGRVSMDIITLDLSTAPDAMPGDEVVLLGQGIDADYLAGISETSCYEVTTRINPLIKRVYI